MGASWQGIGAGKWVKVLLQLGGRRSVQTWTSVNVSQARSYILLPAQVALIYLYKLGADCGEGQGYPSLGICLEVLETSLFLTNHNIAFWFVFLGTVIFSFLAEYQKPFLLVVFAGRGEEKNRKDQNFVKSLDETHFSQKRKFLNCCEHFCIEFS